MTNLKIPISKHERLFRRLTLLTVFSVYLLFAAGSIVRSTGSGMGCPDWPKCFGSWVPPTEAYQLPSNYKEIYGAKLKGEVEFNVVKTWTEYANRLLGVLTGLLIFGTLITSITYLRTSKSNIFYASLAAFILVGFQGWLGSKVVSSELHPLMVTLHRTFSLLVFAVNALLVYRIMKVETKSSLRYRLGFAIIVAIVLEILTGIVMAYFGVPAAAQPLHLTIAIVMLGIQYYLWLEIFSTSSKEKEESISTVFVGQ